MRSQAVSGKARSGVVRPSERILVECLDLFDFRLREGGELLLPRLPRELPIALFQEANQKIDYSSAPLASRPQRPIFRTPLGIDPLLQDQGVVGFGIGFPAQLCL